MARLSPAPSTKDDVNCDGDYVSMDCLGLYGTKEEGRQKLAQAQLSLAADKRVLVYLNDSEKFNSYYCTANRIDVYKN